MSYKTMLAVIQSEKEAEHLIDNAIALAKRHGAHLIGFHPEMVPISYAMAAGLPDAEFLRDATERSVASGKAIAARFEQQVSAAKVSSAWAKVEGVPGDPGGDTLRIARSVDLVISAQPDPDSDVPDTDALLRDSGRPVLVVPRTARIDPALQRIVIGWNGSREAARATFDALPLLKEAKAVDVLVVDATDDARPGEAIAAALARHGVKAKLVAVEKGAGSVEDAIVNYCNGSKADLLVLGAYGHSWLREFLFGGVTRSMLDSAPVATFMSH